MKVKVNDVQLELAPGTSAIDAVFAAGYDVPYFCSQEYMSPIGACRMCLARVGAPRKDRDSGEWILDEASGEPKIFWFPNLMATCTTAVMEGMVIDTLSDDVRKAQDGMVEFTLINHPLDCPVCDKGGACELQDRAYEYGSGRSRFQFDKRHQEKHATLSELITLDRERCIHCKRCVRYFEEVPGDEVLDFIERGGHTFIGTVEDGLPSNFTGNITDICPVGALLDATSRFRGRNWEYDHTPTTSMDDASGSAIVVDARTGRIERIKSGLHPLVNKSWIDDGIRFGHEYVDAADRIREPLLRRDGELVPVPWEEAAAFIAEKLAALDAKQVGIALRADATLEEGVGAKALAEQLATGMLDHAPRPAAGVLGGGPPATLEQLATSDGIFVLGDVTEEVPAVDLRIKDALKGVSPPEPLPHGVPIADLRLKERMERKRERLTVAAPYRVDLMRHAGRVALYPAGGEEALFRALLDLARRDDATNEPAVEKTTGEAANPAANEAADDAPAGATAASDGVDEAALGMTRDEAVALVAQLRAAERPVLVLGGFALASQAAAEAAQAFAKAVDARVMPLGPMANSHGLERIGVTPSHARYGYREMLDGGARALILSNLDPAADTAVAKQLAELDLLVVHAMFHGATTALAQVVLPAKSGYEKTGSTINLEGRLLPLAAAPVDGGAAEDFTGVVKRLGEALGVRLDGRSVRSAQRALKRLLGVDPGELPAHGVLLEPRARGRERVTLRSETAVRGNLLLVPSMARPEYLSRNPHLAAVLGGEALGVNPADAAALELRRDDVVSLTVGGVRRTARVRVSEGVPPGLATLPATPEQPPGLAQADWSTLAKERSALEVA